MADGSRETLRRIEHWHLAQSHGKLAARSMLGLKPVEETIVPFFWTVIHGRTLKYVGHCSDAESADIIIQGSVEKLKFAAYMCNGETVEAVVTMGITEPITPAVGELMKRGEMLTRGDILADISPVDRLRELNCRDLSGLQN